jgi:hypothetical protein
MKSRGRTVTSRVGVAAAVALGVLATAAGDAHASSGEDGLLLLAGVATLGALGGDIAFASHDIDAATKNNLPRDGWLTAEAVVTVPQTLLFNGLLLGFNTSNDETIADVVTAVGILPTAGVTALTTHGIWGLADANTDADAMAGISVITGTNFAFTMAALGRASQRRVHSRVIGVIQSVLTAPGAAVGIYESTFDRPQRGAWIALSGWSTALVVHGIVSAIVDGAPASDPPPATDPGPPGTEQPSLQRASRRGFGPATFTMAPTFLSDGVARVPGIVAVGTF